MMRKIRMFLKLLSRLTLYQLSWIVISLFLFMGLLFWTEVVLESESDPAYDPMLFRHKTFEGHNITPNGTLTVPESQHPTVVWWNSNYRFKHTTAECPNNLKCEVYEQGYKLRENVGGAYIFYASRIDFTNIPLPRQAHNTLWAFTHEESPRNIDLFLHENTLMLFNLSSTYSRHSDVPFPLFEMESFEAITSEKSFIKTSEKNSFLSELAPILYLQSDCQTSTERDEYVKELMNYVKIDSYGKCLQNKPGLPFETEKDYLNHFKNEDFLRFVARYKFHIAIENGVCNDYVTEKFWRPIHVGSIPIYFGSPLIRDWLPNNKSAILIEDFPSPKLLSDYIKKLMINDTLYEEYLEHKTKGVIGNQRLFQELRERPYQTDIDKTFETFECFVCKKLHEFKNKPEKLVVSKKHYDCPIPVSALTLDVNPKNLWVQTYNQNKDVSTLLYQLISQAKDLGSYLKHLQENPVLNLIAKG